MALLPGSPRHEHDDVKGWFAHRDASEPADLLPCPPLIGAERACCCPARPVVTVIMPPAPGRPHPVDLLLCGHHFQVSRAALKAAGAAAYDDTGALLAGGVSEDAHDLGEQAAAAWRP